MSRLNLSALLRFVAILALGVVVGCGVTAGSSGGIPFVDVAIGGKTIRFTLDQAGMFRVEPGHVTRNTARVRPFESTPTDVPTSGSLLVGSEILVSGEDSNVPVTGGADLTATIDGPEAPNPAETGTTVGTFRLTIVGGRVVEVTSGLILPDHLLPLIATNDFTMVLEMEADFPGTITITDLQFSFGPSRPADDTPGDLDEFCDMWDALVECSGTLPGIQCEELIEDCTTANFFEDASSDFLTNPCVGNSYSTCVAEIFEYCDSSVPASSRAECQDAVVRVCLAATPALCRAFESGSFLTQDECLSIVIPLIEITQLELCEGDNGEPTAGEEGQPCLPDGTCNDDLTCGDDYICRRGGGFGALGEPCELAKLTASDAAAWNYFGYSVSVSGNVAVIGAGVGLGKFGSAHVYRYDGITWVEQAKLTASDAAAGDQFGFSVSVSGDLAVIGAYLNDHAGTSAGAAYVFRYNGTTWAEEAKLTASDAELNDMFGSSVSVSGDLAVIGAHGDDDAGTFSGAAYVYRYNGSTWVEEAKLTASDAAADDEFARSVSVSGDLAVIGAHGDDDAGTFSGAAYVFRYNGSSWVEEAKLTASDAAAGDYFGLSVSVSGDRAVIGAYHWYSSSDAGTSSGAAYVFRYNGSTWAEEAKLTASDAAAEDYFGNSVSVSGDWAVIGACWDDDGGNRSGSAYVYRYDGSTWVEQAKLTASDAAADDVFGGSVSVSGDLAVIGAYENADAGSGSGSAYVFALADKDCD